MGRPPIGKRAMTSTERMQRHRAKPAALKRRIAKLERELARLKKLLATRTKR